MKTETDALAAYFEAWREGWPVPAEVTVLDIPHLRAGTPGRVFSPRGINGICQALTGVLVVELARRPGGVDLSHARISRDWHCIIDGTRFGFGPTPLCALVAAWLEVNK